MDTILQILIATIAATSLMTLFSYAVSAAAREVFKEPLLLMYVLSFLHIQAPPKTKSILAWILHYFIGLLFVLGYYILWNYGIMEVSWWSTFILATCIGGIGILGWMFLFNLIDHRPTINYKGYYTQLFIAHIIFSITVFIVYSIFQQP